MMGFAGRFAGFGVLALALLAAAPFGAGQTGQSGQTGQTGQAGQQPQQKPLPLKPSMPGTGQNHRLILKDGSYQIVRQYEIVGDRVRYISVERGGDWEELPADLVDWDATRKWERDHAEAASEQSPAMKEAAQIDKEEAAERDEQKARMPEVAPGLELPDEDSVFVLDTYHGTPELVELKPNELGVDARTHKGLSVISPLAGQRASIELPGAHAKAHLHVNDPAIYLSLDVTDDAEKVVSHAITVNTNGAKGVANGKHGAHSPQSGFAIVRVDERKAVRIVGAIHISPTGNVTQSEDVIAARVEVLAGKHWVKLTPQQPLAIGEYALVEILSPQEISQQVWDFRVDPQLGDNEGSIGPILKQ
jgi:flagellar motor protein MotB